MARGTNPDRFERMVEKLNFNDRSDAADAVKLLRREHAWMVRMVKREFCTEHAASPQKIIGWNQALECILSLLNKRRLG